MNDVLKSAGMVSMFGRLLYDNKKDKNNFQKRMFTAAGLTFPDDWNELTEEEQERRLNNVINLSKDVEPKAKEGA